MLKWIRGTRLDFKTGIFIIALAVIMWAVFAWARIKDFVPEEYKQPVEAPANTR